MPFCVEGWIEVARSPDAAAERAWVGVINLGALVDVADRTAEQLFGLSKECISGAKAVDALAAHRGIPANPSEQVRKAVDGVATHEAEFGQGEIRGFTYATWDEIRDCELLQGADSDQWRIVFDLVRALEKRFESDRIRFVVWFNW
jgi:hypothetical protein